METITVNINFNKVKLQEDLSKIIHTNELEDFIRNLDVNNYITIN